MRKKIIICLINLCLMLPALAQAQQTKNVRSEIKEVTVFLNRAQLTNFARTTVQSGVTDVVLTNFPASFDEQSLQVEALGDVVIYGVRYDQNYLNEQNKPEELQALEDSLNSFKNQLQTLTDQRDIIQKEEALILANQQIGGQKGVEVMELEDMVEFFRNRMTNIRGKLQTLNEQIRLTQVQVTKYQSQFYQYRNRYANSEGQVIITVQASSRKTVDFKISYLIYDAGWEPLYDVRVAKESEPVKLQYKAVVKQNTGINWQNVKLTLSTGNPSVLGATKPELQAWALQLKEKPKEEKRPVTNEHGLTENEMNLGWAGDDDGWGEALAEVPDAATSADFTSMNQSALAVEFALEMPYNIPSDGNAHTVDIQQHQVKANYQHVVVPKLSKDVLLMGHITDWESLNLLSGNANIFYQNTFTGKAFFNLNNTTDTLSFVLGQDKKVIVTREQIKDYKSKSLFGGTNKATFGYEITVRNTKNEAINLKVEDQIPLSSNSQIVVETDDLSGGNLNKETGTVTWNLNLKPAETKKLRLKYTVKYPKDETVENL